MTITMERRSLKVADARRMLGHNTHDRPVRWTRVHLYARDMLAGRWAYAADPIRFDDHGVLLDGQCRLLALIEAGDRKPDVTLDALIVSGLPTAAQRVMDQGRARSLADRMRLEGVRSAAAVAAVTMADCRWERYGMVDGGRVTHMEAFDWYTHHEEDIREATRRGAAWSARSGRLLTPTLMGVCWLRFARVDRPAADRFMHALVTGANLKEHDPVLVLRRRLLAMLAAADDGVACSPRVKAALTVKAWNLTRMGEACTRLEWRPGGATGEVFPNVR